MLAILAGSVNTTWKYGTGSSSASRSASHSRAAAPWLFGQWRLRQVMGVAHYLPWTKPLRGSCRVAIVGADPSYCIFERSDCDIMEALLVAALPCRKGASYECSSTTND